MDASETRKPSPDQRRNAIMDIAHEAFMQDGYSGTSMSRIAALVGGSKATLYSYFPSKKALFFAVVDRECRRFLESLFEVGPARDDFHDAMTDVSRRFLTELLSDRMIASYRLIVAESGRFPEIGQTVYELAVRRGLDRLAAFLQQAMDRGTLVRANAREAAEVFLDLAAGNLHTRRLWSVVDRIDAATIEAEALRIARIFLALYGNGDATPLA